MARSSDIARFDFEPLCGRCGYVFIGDEEVEMYEDIDGECLVSGEPAADWAIKLSPGWYIGKLKVYLAHASDAEKVGSSIRVYCVCFERWAEKEQYKTYRGQIRYIYRQT